jgi:hypothetical protein
MLTADGVKALLKVKAQKLARPDNLNMATWIKTECNGSGYTVSCIAGQLVINSLAAETGLEPNNIKQETFKELTAKDYLDTANKILGFAEDDWEGTASLFDKVCWTEEFKQAYNKAARGSKERAEILGQVIDWFIETNYKPEEVLTNA